MPTVKANGININYDQQGSGEPVILLPFLTADNSCYAFQIAEYAKHFTCISVDPRGAGETDKPAGVYSTELFADDVSAFMQAIGIGRAHIMGLSLGGVIGLWLGAKYPEKVKSLSVHGGWSRTDPFIKTVVEGWQVMAQALGSVTELVIRGIFPWCLTPDLYANQPEYIESLSAFVRSRPSQPVEAFIQQSNAVIAHDVESHLNKINAQTLITFGRYDMMTSRFAAPLTEKIPNKELIVFEDASHATIYEKVDEFNQKTLAFLQRHSGDAASAGTHH
jgi:pimeloyl-ACP methyl ester carboxylesterase